MIFLSCCICFQKKISGLNNGIDKILINCVYA